MKKKIINGILLVALVIAASSAFVSCKDHDSDVDTDLYAKLAELNDQIGKLQTDLDNKAMTPGPKGDPGEKGEKGDQGEKGEKGDTPSDDYIKNLFADDLAALEQMIKDGDAATANKAADDIQKKIDEVKEAMKGFVTSLTAEGTYNPIFGALAAPVSVTSNILAAYYGEGEAVKFHGETVENYYNGDAGTIYFTVNPSEATVKGKFTLVNSQDEAAKVTLEPAESDKVLTWGWNQTRNASGLWAADVTIDDLDAVKFDYSDIASSLKDAIKNRSKSSIIELVGEIYNTVAGDKFPRLALKYTSTDDFFGTRTVRTGYEFGITAIKPLSYDFDIHINKTPYLDKVEKAVYKLINKIKIEFPQIDTNVNFEIKKVDIDARTITVKVPEHWGWKYDIMTGTYDYSLWVKIPEQEFEVDVTDTLQDFQNDEIDNLNNDLATINDLIADIQEINNLQVQFDKSIKDIKSTIKHYFKKADNLICKVVNSTNKALQPTLLVKEGDKVMSAGNKFEAGTITLIPTSYTAEVIAPAFKKFISVECDGKEVLNTGVIDGSINEVELTVESGKNYKVTYDAIDFFGKQRSKTYVISVK